MATSLVLNFRAVSTTMGRLGWVSGSEDHDRGVEFFQSHHHLFSVFGLRHNPQIVFHGQNLGRAGAGRLPGYQPI